MELYRIRKGEKFYKGKSKFTRYGTYFRKEQLEMNIEWVLSKFKDAELYLETYLIENIGDIKLDDSNNLENVTRIIERNTKINEILK